MYSLLMATNVYKGQYNKQYSKTFTFSLVNSLTLKTWCLYMECWGGRGCILSDTTATGSNETSRGGGVLNESEVLSNMAACIPMGDDGGKSASIAIRDIKTSYYMYIYGKTSYSYNTFKRRTKWLRVMSSLGHAHFNVFGGRVQMR